VACLVQWCIVRHAATALVPRSGTGGSDPQPQMSPTPCVHSRAVGNTTGPMSGTLFSFQNDMDACRSRWQKSPGSVPGGLYSPRPGRLAHSLTSSPSRAATLPGLRDSLQRPGSYSSGWPIRLLRPSTRT
jgi:hypothetical protein